MNSGPGARLPFPPGRSVGAGSGAILNLAAFATTMAVSFFLSPYMLRRLGDASFGLLSLTWELGGYFGLFDLGLRSAVNYYVARAAAVSREEELRHVIHTAFWLLFSLSMATLALSWPLASFTVGIIDCGPLDPAVVRQVLMIGFATFALNLAGSLSSAVLAGLRRFDIQASTSMAGTLGGGLLVFSAIQAKLGLVFVAAAQSAGSLLPWAAQQWTLWRWRLTSGLWPPRLRWKEARELSGYGGANLVMRLCELLTFQADQFLIVQAAGPALGAQYHVGRFLGLHSRSLINTVSMVLAPYFTALSASHQQAEIRTFFLRLNRWVNSLAALLLAGVICLGRPFLQLWVGPQYTQGDWWNRSDIVLVMFAAAMAFRSLTAVPYQFLLGTRKLRVLTLAASAEAMLVVAGGAAAIRWKGVAAVALVKLATSVLMSCVVLTPYAVRSAGITAGEYLGKGLAPALLVGAATAATATALSRVGLVQGWGGLFLAAATSALAGAAAFLLFGAGPEDREFLRRKMRTPLG